MGGGGGGGGKEQSIEVGNKLGLNSPHLLIYLTTQLTQLVLPYQLFHLLDRHYSLYILLIYLYITN